MHDCETTVIWGNLIDTINLQFVPFSRVISLINNNTEANKKIYSTS